MTIKSTWNVWCDACGEPGIVCGSRLSPSAVKKFALDQDWRLALDQDWRLLKHKGKVYDVCPSCCRAAASAPGLCSPEHLEALAHGKNR